MSGDVLPHRSIELHKGKPARQNPRAGELKRLYEDAVRAIRPETSNYWVNYAFLEGSQWVYWDEASNRMLDLPRDVKRSRITINRMASNSRTVISKAMQRHLQFEVKRTAADDASIRGARLGETILDAVSTAHDWEVLREKWLQAVWKGGTAAICVDWDPKARDAVIPDSSAGRGPTREGDSKETVLSIAEFAVEPGARDAETARYWFKAQTAPPKEVQATYGLEWEPDADGFTAIMPYQGKFNGNAPTELRTTLVLTYYERPNHLNEKGCIAVVVNDQVVFEGDWPFPTKDRLNLFVGRETVVENRWTGDTILTAARPIQTALNATETNIMEHMKKAGNARLAIPQSSMDIIESLTDGAGELLPYNDGITTPPQWLSPPTMPEWWNARPEALMAQLDDLMGVHDVSRGEAPSNIESGYGVSILVEQDTTPVGRLVKESARVWSGVSSFVLKLYESEIKTKRTVAIVQPGMGAIQTKWSGKDLQGQTDAYVPEEAILPRSRVAQMQNAKDMVEMGMIQPGDIASYMAVSEMPDARHILGAVNPELEWARQENALFAAGRMTVVEPWEDDEAHIREHNRYRNTMDFRLLGDEQKDAINKHILAHETSAAEKLGGRAAGAQINPLLAMAPRADNAPIVDPAMAVGPPPTPPPPEALAMEQVGSETDAILAAMAQEPVAPEGGEALPPF